MSGSGDEFGEDMDKLENVRQLGSTDYLREYTGVLAETNEWVRLITLAPELADIDAAVDAFSQVSDNWYNASANATILTIRERDTEPRPWIAVPDDGETLAVVQPDLAPEAVETVISETADALRTLGLYNTVHRHLSPGDIYLQNGVDETGELTVEVGGFGLEAAIQAAVGEFEPTAYTAPELLDGSNQPTEETDVYGLGAVTYFALTGQAPVGGTNLDQAIRDGPSGPPSVYDDTIPAEVDDVVMQALSPSPNDRYESPYVFGRAFLSTFSPDDFSPDDTDQDSEEEAETTDSPESDRDDDRSQSDEDDSADSGETDETRVSRRAAVGLLGVGALGGAGWYLSRGQLTAANPTDRTTTSDPPAELSASISVTPSDPSVGEDVTFSAAQSTTGEGVSLETYEWAVGADTEFSADGETFTRSFSESGEKTVRLRITDSQDRTATAVTTLAVESVADGAPMFQYNAANTGANPNETGPQTSVTQQWAFETGENVSSSPAVVDDTVYIGSSDNSVYALSAEDGTQQWAFDTGNRVASSPAVVDGTVYVGSLDHSVYALSAADGTQQWAFETGNWVFSSPAVVDGTAYIGSYDNNVYALSAADGTQQWAFETGKRVRSPPVVVDDTVYIGSSDNSVYALSAVDGTQQWSYQTGVGGVASSPAVVDDTVYIGSEDGNVYALSAADGTQQWAFETGERVSSSPAVVNGTVYVGSGDNNVYALSADDGTEQWSYEADRGVWSSPAVVDGTVYVGSNDGNVYALSAADGTQQWAFETVENVTSSPAVVDGTVYIGSWDNNVYALSEQ